MSLRSGTDVALLDRLGAQRWVPVLRCADADDAVATALACGVGAVELTYSTPGVLDAVRRLAGEGLTVGVGTVRTAGQVDLAVAAGAAFVVSFHRPPGFVAAAASAGVPAIPAALTPHEVASAIDEGAPAVKIFPARLVAPAYLSDLRAVFGADLVPLMVTGGIDATAAEVGRWIDAGALCAGIGGRLGTVASAGADEVARRAAALG